MVIFINTQRLLVYLRLFSILLFSHLLIYFDLPLVYFDAILDFTLVYSFASIRSHYFNQAVSQLID